MCKETLPAIHLRPARHSAFPYYEEPFGPESRPTHVWTRRLHCGLASCTC